jgi:hypothetical protein
MFADIFTKKSCDNVAGNSGAKIQLYVKIGVIR